MAGASQGGPWGRTLSYLIDIFHPKCIVTARVKRIFGGCGVHMVNVSFRTHEIWVQLQVSLGKSAVVGEATKVEEGCDKQHGQVVILSQKPLPVMV